MEQKRFGVKNSRVKELRLFQFTLQQRRRTMAVVKSANVSCGGEWVEKTVTANRRTLSIAPSNPPINKFGLPRQPPLVPVGERTITIRINDYMNIKIEFHTMEDCSQFIRALGDLDPLPAPVTQIATTRM